MTSAHGPLHWTHLGRVGYRAAWALQRAAWRLVVEGRGPERLLTLEHDPVITLGRRARAEHLPREPDALAQRGIDLVEVDRGGEATYHGPGQLVVYAIVHTRARAIGPSDLVHALADSIEERLREDGIEAAWERANPGLWVGDAKIAAVGMRIASGVSLHGAALNVTTALDPWQLFVPCGIVDRGITRLADHVDPPPELPALADDLTRRIAARLGSERVSEDDAWTHGLPDEPPPERTTVNRTSE